MTLHLEELSSTTAAAANSLTLRSGQEDYVTPPTYALAETMLEDVASWSRVVLDDDEVVGVIFGVFDEHNPQPEFRAALWRVTVSGDHQGQGIGRIAVEALAEEARSRGVKELTAIWEPGEYGPHEFFTAVGFVVKGETQYGEALGVLEL